MTNEKTSPPPPPQREHVCRQTMTLEGHLVAETSASVAEREGAHNPQNVFNKCTINIPDLQQMQSAIQFSFVLNNKSNTQVSVEESGSIKNLNGFNLNLCGFTEGRNAAVMSSKHLKKRAAESKVGALRHRQWRDAVPAEEEANTAASPIYYYYLLATL